MNIISSTPESMRPARGRVNLRSAKRVKNVAQAICLVSSCLLATSNGLANTGVYQSPFPVHARAEQPSGELWDIIQVVVTGDRDVVYDLENYDAYVNDALYEPMSDADVESFRQKLLADLQGAGYLFATVSVYKPSLTLGALKFRVHVGQLGEVTVAGNKYHSEKNITESMEWEEGKPFNYKSFYENVNSLNTKDSMSVETELTPSVDEYGRRVVDAEFKVEERFPINVALNVNNDGSKVSSFNNSGSPQTDLLSSWRSRLTVDWDNMSENNDKLTLSWLTDPANYNDINAASVAYSRPITDDVTGVIYGGISESNLDNVFPGFDVVGKGHFIGANFNFELQNDQEATSTLSAGWFFQEADNENVFLGSTADSRRIRLSTPRFTYSHSDKKDDAFGGRNFFANTLSFSIGGLLGTSSNAEIEKHSPGAEDTFVINRVQFARYQPFTFTGEDDESRWSMYARFDGQITSDGVPSPLYKIIGGAGTVRGYRYGSAVGDYGYNGSVEISTPMLENFIPGLERDEQYLKDNPKDWAIHRLRMITFIDMGYVRFHDSETFNVPGREQSQFLAGTGFGFRMGLTKYTQMSLDFAFPLHEVEDSDNQSPRAHFSAQVQF